MHPHCKQDFELFHTFPAKNAMMQLLTHDIFFWPKTEKTELDIPEGLTRIDVMRPIREAVPNATVRIPKKIINRCVCVCVCVYGDEFVREETCMCLKEMRDERVEEITKKKQSHNALDLKQWCCALV
jgi:hypothetical protein